jgi:hypothetical protein
MGALSMGINQLKLETNHYFVSIAVLRKHGFIPPLQAFMTYTKISQECTQDGAKSKF